MTVPATATAINEASQQHISISPYLIRCFNALIKKPTTREQLDRIIGTNNSPVYIRKMRNMGIKIRTERFQITNRDGVITSVARYHLEDESKEAAKALIGGA